MKTVWMEILRPGKWNEWDFTPDYLRDLTASYDPTVREAPLVVGHPGMFEEEKPAHGWAKKLELRPFGDNPDQDDVSVWALVEIGEEAEAMIKDRKFPKRSAGISEEAPFPGIPYLSHIALLGASNPAVSSLTEVELAAGFTASDGILCLAQINGKDIELAWESKETEYWYRVRPPTKFRDDTFRSRNLTTGLRAVIAKYKPEYVPEGRDADSMTVQALRFDKSKFDLARAKAWVNEHKGELSQMPDNIKLVDDAELKTLKAQNENLQKQLKDQDEKMLKEKVRAEKAEKELRERELARLENQYEIELKSLVEAGNGAPAYIELGVHKALVAMDAADVKVTLDSGEKSASEIILSALKAVPKFIEHKEVVTQLSSGNGKGESGNVILRDNSFDRAMDEYVAKGDSVVGMDIKALTDKLMGENKELPIYEAILQASKILASGGKS